MPEREAIDWAEQLLRDSPEDPGSAIWNARQRMLGLAPLDRSTVCARVLAALSGPDRPAPEPWTLLLYELANELAR